MFTFDDVIENVSGRKYYTGLLVAICFFYEVMAAMNVIAPVFLGE